MKRRKHGKRTVVAQLARIRSKVLRITGSMIERDGKMELAHALLAIRQAQQFIRNAERLTGRTL